MFWSSGIIQAARLEGRRGRNGPLHTSNPPAAFNLATLIVISSVGSALIISGPATPGWAPGALAIFTVLTIPIVHPFWNMPWPVRAGRDQLQWYTVMEHISIVGALILVSILRSSRAVPR